MYALETLSFKNSQNNINFRVENTTNMVYMFYCCRLLRSLDLDEVFDTSKVITMEDMFQDCNSLISLNLGNNFDTSNVVSFENMFCCLYTITKLNLMGKFSIKSANNIGNMFAFQGGKEVKLYLGIFGEEMDNTEKNIH